MIPSAMMHWIDYSAAHSPSTDMVRLCLPSTFSVRICNFFRQHQRLRSLQKQQNSVTAINALIRHRLSSQSHCRDNRTEKRSHQMRSTGGVCRFRDIALIFILHTLLRLNTHNHDIISIVCVRRRLHSYSLLYNSAIKLFCRFYFALNATSMASKDFHLGRNSCCISQQISYFNKDLILFNHFTKTKEKNSTEQQKEPRKLCLPVNGKSMKITFTFCFSHFIFKLNS